MINSSGKINILLLAGIFVILIVIGVLIYQTFLSYQKEIKEKEFLTEESLQEEIFLESQEEEEEILPLGGVPAPVTYMKALEGKNIAIIIAFKDFRDQEYFVPRQIFRAAGAEVKIVSTEMGIAIGADGGEVEVELLVKNLNLADFDALVFIGGPGALKYLDNEDSYKLIKEAISQDKLLTAICISPVILAKVGVLEGKKVTVWSSPMDKSPIKILEENGAIYQDDPVVIDGKIITGNGPAAAEQFGMAIVEILTAIQ